MVSACARESVADASCALMAANVPYTEELYQKRTLEMSPATVVFVSSWTISVPFPMFATSKYSVSSVLGDPGVTEAAAAITSTPAW
jgi:hypothetical protein